MLVSKNIRTATLAAALLALLPTVALAQDSMTATEAKPVDHHRKPAEKKAGAPEPQYPKATRTEPKIVETALQDKLAKVSEEAAQKKDDDAIAGAEEILANPKAVSTDRSLAAYYAGYAALDKTPDDYTRALGYFQRALSENGLANNEHYSVMLNVARMQMAQHKYDDVLVTAQRFLSETQSEDPKVYAMVGNSQYRLGHYADAVVALKKVLTGGTDAVDTNNVVQMLIASYQELKQPNEAVALAEQLSAQNPDDKNAQMLVANIYAGAGQPEKAGAIFDRLRAKGLLTESADYETGVSVLDSIGHRAKDIIALINEGLDKKILTPSADIYGMLGQSYYDTEQMSQAIAAWEKGAPLAQNGEMYLNLAVVHGQNNEWAASKASAKQALAKGLDHPGEAWIQIAQAESGLGNKPARLAAYREAAKDPKTQSQASKALKQSGAK